MSSYTKKHEPLSDDQPRQFEVTGLFSIDSPALINEYSILINTLHRFAPTSTFEIEIPKESNIRSIEVGSVEIWERVITIL